MLENATTSLPRRSKSAQREESSSNGQHYPNLSLSIRTFFLPSYKKYASYIYLVKVFNVNAMNYS